MKLDQPSKKRWIIAVTGASGTTYARRLLEVLLEGSELDLHIDLVFSEAALRVLKEEDGIQFSPSRTRLRQLLRMPNGFDDAAVTVHNNRDIGAAIASGSCRTEGMVIVPCSMNTLAAVASGISSNLIHRAADVTLKERRKLIIVPRETPLSEIHLENMLRLSRMGTAIVAAMPGFYQKPESISDLVDSVVMRILDQMGFSFNLLARWDGVPEKLRVVRSIP